MQSLIECRGTVPLIASGGVRSGIDAAKAIAIGAHMAGAAYPFIKALGENKLGQFVDTFKKQMKVCAYLTGSATHEDLKNAKTYFF